MTAPKFKIKKGDQVIVLSGKDKGKKSEVLKVFPSTGKAIVAGVNTAKKHEKATATSPGGIVPKDMPIQISNLAIVDPKTGAATRVGYKTLDNGEKVRYAKKSGEVLS